MNEVRKTCLTGKLPPPVGTSEWDTFSRDSYCVDKTRMIKDLVDLKVSSPLEMGSCAVEIPNREIRQVFEMDILPRPRSETLRVRH